VLKRRSQTSRIGAGAVILNLGELAGEIPREASAISRESHLGRILARKSGSGVALDADSAVLRGFAIKETDGLFIISPDGGDSPEEQVVKGAAAAARASAYLYQGILRPRDTAVIIDSKLCRGCGDCAAICSYIEMRERSSGIPCAYIDQALCLGCGACIAHCRTGAITQPLQSDEQIGSTLEALLGKVACAVDAR